MNPVDQLALMVGLTEFHFELVTCGGGAGERLDVPERRPAIGLRLACAEQIEVRAVEDKDDFRHGAAVPSPLYRHPPRKGKAARPNGQRLSRLSEYDARGFSRSANSWLCRSGPC